MGRGGKNGFSKILNVNVYTLLAVWESEEAAASYFDKPKHFSGFQRRATEFWTIYTKTSKVHGTWYGRNPFETIQTYQSGPIAVITRARIKFLSLRKFWSYIPSVSKNMEDRESKMSELLKSIFQFFPDTYSFFKLGEEPFPDFQKLFFSLSPLAL